MRICHRPLPRKNRPGQWCRCRRSTRCRQRPRMLRQSRLGDPDCPSSQGTTRTVIPPRFLLALDLDGTLLRDDKTIAPEDAAAIRGAAAHGIAVTLATGRLTTGTLPTARELGLSTPLVCADGGLLVDPQRGEALDRSGIPSGRGVTGDRGTVVAWPHPLRLPGRRYSLWARGRSPSTNARHLVAGTGGALVTAGRALLASTGSRVPDGGDRRSTIRGARFRSLARPTCRGPRYRSLCDGQRCLVGGSLVAPGLRQG